MSKAKIKYVQDKVESLESAVGYGWQMRADNHVGVLTVLYDQNSGPNGIAALPKGHPMKREKYKDAIAEDAAVALQGEALNFYSFNINAKITEPSYTAQASKMVGQKLLPKLMVHTAATEEKEIILYPANGTESFVPWLLNAFAESGLDHTVEVVPVKAQIAKVKSVDAIALRLIGDVEDTKSKLISSAGLVNKHGIALTL